MDGQTIEYEVRRSKRRKKTVQITLDGRTVRVAVPWKLRTDAVRQIVRGRAAWIFEHLSRAVEESAREEPVLGSGETLPYLGRWVPLSVVRSDALAPTVRFDGCGVRVELPGNVGDAEQGEIARAALVHWYKACAAERLPTEVDRWTAKFGWAERPLVLVRDQRSRWGSCAANGTLRFNWRLMMLDPSLIEYVVVHELAHRTQKNHSPDFWKLVAGALPEVKSLRRCLNEAEKGLPA